MRTSNAHVTPPRLLRVGTKRQQQRACGRPPQRQAPPGGDQLFPTVPTERERGRAEPHLHASPSPRPCPTTPAAGERARMAPPALRLGGAACQAQRGPHPAGPSPCLSPHKERAAALRHTSRRGKQRRPSSSFASPPGAVNCVCGVKAVCRRRCSPPQQQGGAIPQWAGPGGGASSRVSPQGLVLHGGDLQIILRFAQRKGAAW